MRTVRIGTEVPILGARRQVGSGPFDGAGRPQGRLAGGMPMLSVVIAVEDSIARLGLQAVLDGSDVARTVANLSEPADLEPALEAHEPDILLLDVWYRWEDPRLIQRLSKKYPSVRILMYVRHTAEECVLRHLMEAGQRSLLSPDAVKRLDECCLTSIRGGAQGCLARESAPADVIRAVQALGAGEVVAAPWLHAIANGHMSSAGRVESARAITARELEVMALLARGMGNKAIARKLRIREQTVKNHLARIMDKLGVSNRFQVGLLADRHNLRLEDPASVE